jgi:hypothetical protein
MQPLFNRVRNVHAGGLEGDIESVRPRQIYLVRGRLEHLQETLNFLLSI